MKKIIALLKDESGATAIEYGLIAALISIAAVAALGTTGDELNTTFENVTTKMEEGNAKLNQ